MQFNSYFNDIILFNTVSYIILDFKLKIDPFKILEEIWKTRKNFEKISSNPIITSNTILLVFLS